ncbi:MAG TPA: dihydroxy-acid dehydratase [Clostridia bacterium]|mgnify:CR=1 FL=1|jgi:dihydroxy-acid dehydratase|nr:dihydroxy-acid dehydratase [Clostridia bacterium]
MFERSKWDFGVASVTRDGLLYGLGYTPDELKKPYIAVVNSWNEYNPGHIHLKELAERVKQGIREAGGLPFEVVTTGLCDGMVLKDPRYIELPSRNLVADEVELNVEANMFDGMVLLSTCDSIVPGHLMAAARCDIPTVMVTGGYMPHCRFRGNLVGLSEVTLKVGKVLEGKYSMEDFTELNQCAHAGQGACGSMTTGNSMCCIAEALGMTMPGNATMDATDKRLGGMAYEAGLQVMRLVREGITARHFITEKSIENAIMVNIACAGSTNLLLHIPAIAHEAGIDRDWWSYFDQASHDIPLLVCIAPSDPRHYFVDFDAAGGFKAFMHNLMPKLHQDCPTINGKTIYENYKDAKVYNPEVIHSIDDPVIDDGGIAVLHGNIAPDGAIVKLAGVPTNLYHFEGKAIIFHEIDDAIAALRAGEIKPGHAIIIRYLGPKGRFGTTAFTFQKELAGTDLFDKVAIITDGRFSGGSHGLSIGYVAPEAAIRGPLAVVKDGDTIVVDMHNRSIDMVVSDEEIQERFKTVDWQLEASKFKPFLRLFAKNVTSTAKGATWDE